MRVLRLILLLQLVFVLAIGYGNNRFSNNIRENLYSFNAEKEKDKSAKKPIGLTKSVPVILPNSIIFTRPVLIDLNSLYSSSIILGNLYESISTDTLTRSAFDSHIHYNAEAISNSSNNAFTGHVPNLSTFILDDAPPIASDDATVTSEDTPITLNLLANDSDPEGALNTASVSISNQSGGTFSVDGAGILTFTPTADFNGTATANYSVLDSEGLVSNQALITITVTAVNDAPVAVNDATSTTEDTPVTVNVTTNDTDVDGSINTGTIVISAQVGGTFVSDASGTITFTPTTDFSGAASASYTVQDNSGAVSNLASISITVAAGNDAPVANSDAASTNEDVAITVNVVANDVDADGSINTASVVISAATGGSFVANASGEVTFTPTANFAGTATANYTVQDNSGATSNVATITITVTAINDAPVAVNDASSTTEETAVAINVISNDTDVDGTINAGSVVISNSVGGTFIADANGIITFTPAANFSGSATANYTVNDNAGATSNIATITVTVSASNDAPVANNDAVATPEDTPITYNVITNDTDIDGTVNPATVVLGSGSNGTWSVNASGIISYSPNSNFNGTATNTYTVKDNGGLVSNSATITITVDAVNDPPIAANDAITTAENSATTIGVLVNDTDPDGPGSISASTVVLSGQSNGAFSVDAAGIVTYSPPADFNGTATASYTVRDISGALSNSATITITVTAVNNPPVAANDVATTNEDAAVNVTVGANDTDVDGTVVLSTVSLISGSDGTWTANSAGIVTYTPSTNFNGTATGIYTIKDNSGATSNQATITITVTSVNDLPVANNDITSTNEDVAVTVNVVTNDSDPDGSINPSTISINSMVGGSFSANASGLVTFTPLLDFTGTATASYTVQDNSAGTSNVATITVSVSDIEDAPRAVNDNASTNEDVPVALNVLANDTDVDGTVNPATLDLDVAVAGEQKSVTTAQGTFTASASGVVTYTPTPNFTGTATINYTVNDNNNKVSNQGTISIVVTPSNDPPSFQDIPDLRILANSADRTIVLVSISPGPGENGERLLITASSGNTALIPNPIVIYDGTSPTGTLTFKPQPGQSGTATITVKVVDTALNEYTQTFNVDVVEVNFTSSPTTVALYGEPFEYNIAITEVDAALSIIVVQKPDWLTFTTDNKTAILRGTPPPTASLRNQIKLQVTEGTAILDEQEFELVVNHRPVISAFSLQTSEDVSIVFTAENFNQVYTDVDNQPIGSIQFTQLPKHGVLLLNNNAIAPGEEIPFSSITNLSYRPSLDYVGPDTVYWKASDGFSYSLQNPFINIEILPINDPPVITFFETETLVYEVGNEVARVFTLLFDAQDPDGDNIIRAEIGFRRPNFDPENDVLSFTNTSKITGVYDSQIGILTLTGAATAQEYVQAIRSISYNFINLEDLTLADRTIYITLSDGKANSTAMERTIDLIYTFVDLDIPTAFTPNGDNANDFWKITSAKGIEQYTKAVVRVFNKQGQVVYETQGFNRFWDGTFNGKVVPPDTYFYTIDLQYNKVQYKGIVTILR